MRGSTEHDPQEVRTELAREALTMMLYVSVVLLAALVALPLDDEDVDIGLSGVIWGTSIGLAVAHWFAFHLSARLFGDGDLHVRDAQSAAVQVLAALAVAVVASLPLLVVSDETGVDVAVGELTALIAVAGYQAARRGGAGHGRAVMAALSTLTIGAVCVVVKAMTSH
jgi:hypothetical protein